MIVLLPALLGHLLVALLDLGRHVGPPPAQLLGNLTDGKVGVFRLHLQPLLLAEQEVG